MRAEPAGPSPSSSLPMGHPGSWPARADASWTVCFRARPRCGGGLRVLFHGGEQGGVEQSNPITLAAGRYLVGHGHAGTPQLRDYPCASVSTQPKPYPLPHTHFLDDFAGPGHHGAVLRPVVFPFCCERPEVPFCLDVLLGAAGDLALALLGEPGETLCDRLTGGPVARAALLQVVVGALVVQVVDDQPGEWDLGAVPSVFEVQLLSVFSGEAFQPARVRVEGEKGGDHRGSQRVGAWAHFPWWAGPANFAEGLWTTLPGPN